MRHKYFLMFLWNNSKINMIFYFVDFLDVMGPDEDHESISNNVYTNVIVGYALYFAK